MREDDTHACHVRFDSRTSGAATRCRRIDPLRLVRVLPPVGEVPVDRSVEELTRAVDERRAYNAAPSRGLNLRLVELHAAGAAAKERTLARRRAWGVLVRIANCVVDEETERPRVHDVGAAYESSASDRVLTLIGTDESDRRTKHAELDVTGMVVDFALGVV